MHLFGGRICSDICSWILFVLGTDNFGGQIRGHIKFFEAIVDLANQKKKEKQQSRERWETTKAKWNSHVRCLLQKYVYILYRFTLLYFTLTREGLSIIAVMIRWTEELWMFVKLEHAIPKISYCSVLCCWTFHFKKTASPNGSQSSQRSHGRRVRSYFTSNLVEWDESIKIALREKGRGHVTRKARLIIGPSKSPSVNDTPTSFSIVS